MFVLIQEPFGQMSEGRYLVVDRVLFFAWNDATMWRRNGFCLPKLDERTFWSIPIHHKRPPFFRVSPCSFVALGNVGITVVSLGWAEDISSAARTLISRQSAAGVVDGNTN